jgi:chitodextrinase
VITGLSPKTKYNFFFFFSNGQLIQTASVSATTLKYTAVKSLKSTAKTSNSVTLSWQPPTAKGNTDGYVIEIYNASGKVSLDTIYVTGVNATKFTVSGLKAKTQYTFVVKAAEGQLVSSAAKVKVTTKT